MADNPKNDDAFDDADFEDLDPIDDDLGDDGWEEAGAETIPDDTAGDAAIEDAGAAVKEKTFVQKNFKLIVGAVVVVFGGVIALSFMGGQSPAPAPGQVADDGSALPDASAVTELTDNAEMPPMPAPINPGESAPAPGDDALTPMPTPEQLQNTELAELTVDEVPAAPAGAPVKEGEAPFDFESEPQAVPAPENAENEAADLNAGLQDTADNLPLGESPSEATQQEMTVDAPEAPATTQGVTTDAPEPLAPAPTLTDTEPLPEIETPAPTPAVADLTPQIEEQKSQIESLESKLASQNEAAEKEKAELEASLKAKDEQIAQLNKSIADLEKKLAEARAAVSETAEISNSAKQPAETATSAPSAVKPKPKALVEDQAPAKAPAATIKVSSWELKGAQPGKAVLSSKTTGDTRTVEVGDNVEGLGRIVTIARENGRWTVRGTKGSVIR